RAINICWALSNGIGLLWLTRGCGRPLSLQEVAGDINATNFFRLRKRKKERKRVERELHGGGGDHYSPPTSGGHNFRTGAPIDASFAATRSSLHPLRFYPNIEIWVSSFPPHSSLPILRKSSSLTLVDFRILIV
ncbi:hypothetical protein PIB30_062342, partial [Stylosanthes scabra]|nr:hypothetical protein [Stylosanthes scabra]